MADIVSDYIIGRIKDDSVIKHHGIKGQKWGKRRYQNPDGSLTPLGRKRYGVDDNFEAEMNARKKAAESSDSDYEYRKQVALRSGSAADIMKFRGDLTNQQLNDALNRLRLEEQIRASIPTTKDKVDKFLGNVRTGINVAQAGVDIYNIAAKVNNAFNPNKELAIIGSGDSLKRIRQREEEHQRQMELDDIIKKGSPAEIQKNLGRFSTSDIESMNKRLDFEDKISKKIAKENGDSDTSSTSKNNSSNDDNASSNNAGGGKKNKNKNKNANTENNDNSSTKPKKDDDSTKTKNDDKLNEIAKTVSELENGNTKSSTKLIYDRNDISNDSTLSKTLSNKQQKSVNKAVKDFNKFDKKHGDTYKQQQIRDQRSSVESKLDEWFNKFGNQTVTLDINLNDDEKKKKKNKNTIPQL